MNLWFAIRELTKSRSICRGDSALKTPSGPRCCRELSAFLFSSDDDFNFNSNFSFQWTEWRRQKRRYLRCYCETSNITYKMLERYSNPLTKKHPHSQQLSVSHFISIPKGIHFRWRKFFYFAPFPHLVWKNVKSAPETPNQEQPWWYLTIFHNWLKWCLADPRLELTVKPTK